MRIHIGKREDGNEVFLSLDGVRDSCVYTEIASQENSVLIHSPLTATDLLGRINQQIALDNIKPGGKG